jgi:hypothetical protein
MLANEIQNAKDIIKITQEFKKENKEELLMLVEATKKLENIRIALETAKRDYQKSWRYIFRENFNLCAFLALGLLLLIAAIYVPAFSLQFGSFKAEKTHNCSSFNPIK